MGSVFDEKFNKSTLLVIDLEWDFVDKFEQKVDIPDWELIEIGAATSTPSRHPRMLPITSKVIIPEIKQTVSKTFTDITTLRMRRSERTEFHCKRRSFSFSQLHQSSSSGRSGVVEISLY